MKFKFPEFDSQFLIWLPSSTLYLSQTNLTVLHRSLILFLLYVFSCYFFFLELKSLLQFKTQYNCHPHHKSFPNISVHMKRSFLRILKLYIFFNVYCYYILYYLITLCSYILLSPLENKFCKNICSVHYMSG